MIHHPVRDMEPVNERADKIFARAASCAAVALFLVALVAAVWTAQLGKGRAPTPVAAAAFAMVTLACGVGTVLMPGK
jgi:hypothetical protein